MTKEEFVKALSELKGREIVTDDYIDEKGNLVYADADYIRVESIIGSIIHEDYVDDGSIRKILYNKIVARIKESKTSNEFF